MSTKNFRRENLALFRAFCLLGAYLGYPPHGLLVLGTFSVTHSIPGSQSFSST